MGDFFLFLKNPLSIKKSNSFPRRTLFITSKKDKSTNEGEKKNTVEGDCHSNQIRTNLAQRAT